MTEPERQADDEETGETRKPGILAIAFSVIAAAFGVQSDANRRRDFSHGSPLAYIIGGLIFTVLFVLTVLGVVMLVVP